MRKRAQSSVGVDLVCKAGFCGGPMLYFFQCRLQAGSYSFQALHCLQLNYFSFPISFVFSLFLPTLSPGILTYIHLTTFTFLRKAAKGNDNWGGIIMSKGKTFQNQGKIGRKTTTAATSSFFQIYIPTSSPWPSWSHFVPKFCPWTQRSLLSVVQVSKERPP